MKVTQLTAFLIRLSLGFIYMSAGWSKFASEYLGNLIGPPDISNFTDSILIIASFKVIALFQIIAGALILSQRYSLIGLLALFPLSIGILAFTLLTGFAGTPIFNLVFLLMNVFALNIEKDSLKRLMNRDFSVLLNSGVTQIFPGKKYPHIAFGLLILLVISSFGHPILLNVLATATILAFTINFLQYKEYIFVDKLLLLLFFSICFIATNGILLNTIIPKFFYSVFYLILIGFVLYLLRIIIWPNPRKSIEAKMD